MEYQDFLIKKEITDINTGHEPGKLHPILFDFQKDIDRWAIRRGRAAVFLDCGMGKTFCQLEWARSVYNYTGGKVLILAPLAVSKQTKQEAKKINIDVTLCRSQNDITDGINITNYEMLHKFKPDEFIGIVLDESGILKSFTGKIRNQLIEYFAKTPYKLSCTATPAPNDFVELGNQAEFLGVMTRVEMLSMFFVNDTANTGTWRLKKHAENKFWEWLSSWSVMMRKPSDLGYDDNDFILPKLNINHITVPCGIDTGNYLFPMPAKTLTERRNARKESLIERVKIVADLINCSDETWLVWCGLNTESEMLKKAINNSVEIKGVNSAEHKEKSMMDFADDKIKCLISKSKISGWGMNWQNCHNMVFCGLSDSYESYYQSIRRCWRFGQKKEVNVHIVTSEKEVLVVQNIQRKEKDILEMAENMTLHMSKISEKNIKGGEKMKTNYTTNKTTDENWTLHNADCIDAIKDIKTDSIHYSIFSPPFAQLFCYSNSNRDMGNCSSQKEFMDHFKYLSNELYRVIMPGRLMSFHVMNIAATIQRDGYIGIKDLRGDLIRLFQDAGFIFHSEVCIWKDPLLQAVRTKTLTLMHKQISKDASRCAQGLPDYVITMRKVGDNPEPVAKGRGFERYVGDMGNPKFSKNDNDGKNKYSHHVWQRYASPVWFDINQTRTLNGKLARENNDERHCCPLQLDVIERCLELWTNPDDTVLSPFAGIGSEGYVAVQTGRKFIGIELKKSYFDLAVKNLIDAKKINRQLPLFGEEK